MFYRFGLLCRTVYHLKLVQIFSRLWFKFYKPKVTFEPVPSASSFKGLSVPCAQRCDTMLSPFEWIFLNENGKLDEIGWQDTSRSKLWRYNQHYFDDLNALSAVDRIEWHKLLIERWIIENPIGIGHGWEPYPTSLRIVNWIKWSASTNALSCKAKESLSLQAKWLLKRLEWHLLGNHLFVNAKALIFAGIYFEGNEANRWLIKGMQILKKQVPEQILSDGSHFELTPMYHALVLEDLLDLVNIFKANPSRCLQNFEQQIQTWRAVIPKMLTWLINMSHPDGQISFFNDAAFGVAPSNIELLNYAKRLKFYSIEPKNGITDLKKSGFVRMQSDNALLIADIGQVGPDYLPGHAHADTLSFEFSFKGRRIFVNSGTSTYSPDNERQRQRGTLAHNTLCVAGQNSSEVWSGFRVGARAKIKTKSVFFEGDRMSASGSHNGYVRNNHGLIHCRNFLMTNRFCKITDEISLLAPAVVRFHLHPNVVIKKIGDAYGQIEIIDGECLYWRFSGAEKVEIKNSSWHPEFGSSIPNHCIIAHLERQNCEFTLKWT